MRDYSERGILGVIDIDYSSYERIWESPKLRGDIFGVYIMRISISWGLY